MTTAQEVYEQAQARFGRAGVAELAAVYAGLPGTDPAAARRVVLVPPPVAGFATGVLADAVKKVGPKPSDLLRISLYDPRCGVGVFLVDAARRLAGLYARRLTQMGRRGGRAGRVVEDVLADVVYACVYGMDSDPLAVDVARLALSLATGGRLVPQELHRHIVVGDRARGDVPPAKHNRSGTVDLVPTRPS